MNYKERQEELLEKRERAIRAEIEEKALNGTLFLNQCVYTFDNNEVNVVSGIVKKEPSALHASHKEASDASLKETANIIADFKCLQASSAAGKSERKNFIKSFINSHKGISVSELDRIRREEIQLACM